ncbi:Ionotropic glutamate receptor [Corchorus capsularis]|uniref:Ionotropic glutamate receptor n=1 Tax=Corchorus capsularis TaxID=210143 RepID=A0A1R3GF47_COCAP|nr:Ionotropic glutamate receptor [Corchorus capsularis]
MVVKAKADELNKLWWFLTPFTPNMWLAVVALITFSGFTIWKIEGQYDYGHGPSWIEALLFFGQRQLPRNNLTYLVMVPRLFLFLVLISVYTSTLTSMITSSLETDQASCFDIQNLIKTNASIGCDKNKFKYLVRILGFQSKNIKDISESSIDDYEKALSNGNIEAAFFSVAYGELFLAKFRKGFSAWEPIRGSTSSTMVFPRGSPFVKEMSKLNEMPNVIVSLPDCSSSTVNGSKSSGIGPGPFLGLFILCDGASALALFIMLIRLIIKRCEGLWIQRMLLGRGFWICFTTLFSRNQRGKEIQFRL